MKSNFDEVMDLYPDLTSEEREMLLTIRDRKFEVLKEINELKARLNEVNQDIYAMESLEGLRLKQLQMGRSKFNVDPKKGIQFLTNHDLIEGGESSLDVARFLFTDQGLSKSMIGEYLGEKKDFNEEVLKHFVESHDFTNQHLVQSLRQFLWSFRLPGEAQKIDRMMEMFATRYCSQNADVFTSSDTCYVLSFSTIMLNTSLHNPNVKDKPTLDQFIVMNRGLDAGGDLSPELLTSLYDDIKREPFKIPDENEGGNFVFANADKEGWLSKQSQSKYKGWKRRWFVLNQNCLYYFEYTTDREPKGIIPLENVKVRVVSNEIANKENCFEIYSSISADNTNSQDGHSASSTNASNVGSSVVGLGSSGGGGSSTDSTSTPSSQSHVIKSCKTDSDGKLVEGRHTVYRMYSATAEDRDEWVTCLQRSINHNPFQDMLIARQQRVQLTSTSKDELIQQARSSTFRQQDDSTSSASLNISSIST